MVCAAGCYPPPGGCFNRRLRFCLACCSTGVASGRSLCQPGFALLLLVHYSSCARGVPPGLPLLRSVANRPLELLQARPSGFHSLITGGELSSLSFGSFSAIPSSACRRSISAQTSQAAI